MVVVVVEPGTAVVPGVVPGVVAGTVELGLAPAGTVVVVATVVVVSDGSDVIHGSTCAPAIEVNRAELTAMRSAAVDLLAIMLRESKSNRCDRRQWKRPKIGSATEPQDLEGYKRNFQLHSLRSK